MEKLSYKLEAFEGPLDLLLHLISKHKLDILDIPIAELLEQYMEQIRSMQEQDMDVASEFLEMAARLVYIKTISLLPKHEEAEELKQELTGQLLEYQECKKMAMKMADQFEFNTYVREAMVIETNPVYKRKHTPQELFLAYQNAVGRGKRFMPPPVQAFSGIVTHRVVSVASKIIFVLRRLWKQKELPYQELFRQNQEKSELVATFLAVLELVKGKRIRIEGEEDFPKVRLMSGGGNRWTLKKSEEQ